VTDDRLRSYSIVGLECFAVIGPQNIGPAGRPGPAAGHCGGTHLHPGCYSKTNISLLMYHSLNFSAVRV
jgi:hypothetical protein